METEYQPWAQLVIPAAILFLHALIQLYWMPPKKDKKTNAEFRKAIVVMSIAIYFGVVSITPVGFTYFIAFVKAGGHFWAWLFFGAIGIATYRSRSVTTSERHTSKSDDLFFRVFVIALFGGYLKLSEIIWIIVNKHADAILQGGDFLYQASIVAILGAWVTLGAMLLGEMIVSRYEKRPDVAMN